MKHNNISIAIATLIGLSGCISSRMQNITISKSEIKKVHPIDKDYDKSNDYYFISCEPFHFIATLGVLPQYHSYYKIPTIRDSPIISADKYSKCIGWAAIFLPLTPEWHYGNGSD